MLFHFNFRPRLAGYVSLRALLLTPLRLLVPFPAVLFRGCAVAFRWLL